MAYALVGSLGTPSQVAVNTAITPAYGQTPTANNLLILWVGGRGANANPATPTGWSPGSQFLDAAHTLTATVFYKIAAGGDPPPTIAATASMIWSAQLGEFSGAPATPLDQSAGAFKSVTPGVLAAPATDALPGELVIYGGSLGSFVQTQTCASTGHNFTANDTTNNSTSTAAHYIFGYGITTTNATPDSNSIAFDDASDNLAVVLCSFLVTLPSQPRQLGTGLVVTAAWHPRPSSLTHPRALGNPAVIGREIQPRGITHTRAQGNPTLSGRALPPSLTHARGTSSPNVNRFTILPTGLARAGFALLYPTSSLYPTSTLYPTSSTRLLGSPNIQPWTIAPKSQTRTRVQGSPAIDDSRRRLTPLPITHGRSQGNPTLSARTLPAGLIHIRATSHPAVDQTTIIIGSLDRIGIIYPSASLYPSGSLYPTT